MEAPFGLVRKYLTTRSCDKSGGLSMYVRTDSQSFKVRLSECDALWELLMLQLYSFESQVGWASERMGMPALVVAYRVREQ